MRCAALLCLALLTTGPAFAEPMKIVEPDDGRASDQYWSPAQRVTPGRHLMEKRAPIGSAVSQNGEAGWAGAAGAGRPSPVLTPDTDEPQPVASSEPARKDIYLGHLIEDGGFRFAYRNLLQAMGTPPTWLRRFHETRDGVQLPSKKFTLDDNTYVLSRVCKPHDTEVCWTVLFREADYVAWGYLSDGDRGQWVGTPPLAAAEAVERRLGNPNYFD